MPIFYPERKYRQKRPELNLRMNIIEILIVRQMLPSFNKGFKNLDRKVQK